MSLTRFFTLAVLCASLAFMAFYPGLGGGFVFDDTPNIVTNLAVHVTALDLDSLLHAAYSFQPGGGSRFLPMLSFGLDHWRGGLDPHVFKSTNLLIHALTTVVLACFLRLLLMQVTGETTRASRLALVLALLWAIHPLQVSSVLYVVQRMQTLVTLFLLLALFFYVRARGAQIEGQSGRRDFLLTLFCWGLAFACKEDAVLLPVYTLALELTVLNFRSTEATLSTRLRQIYLFFVLAGAAVFLLYIVPKNWHWEAYPGRDFSTVERLLTQGRVLLMYLGQILLPLPQNLPFYYDDLKISRSLWQPLTTLPALLGVAGLLAWAWYWRQRRLLFAFGVFLFFAGHFVSSNVIGLELAFEHRNHLPLIGVLLAAADLLSLAATRFQLDCRLRVAMVVVLFSASAGLTWTHASIWGQPLEFARAGVEKAPGSVRAWILLCNTYFQMSGGKSDSPYLEQAIQTCEKGGELPYSATMLGNVVVFKAIQGTVSEADWQRFLSRLRSVTMNVENKRLASIMVNNVKKGIALDEKHVLETLKIIVERAPFSTIEYIHFAYFLVNHTKHPEEAYGYMERAVLSAAQGDPSIMSMLEDLERSGYDIWARQLRDLAHAQGKLSDPS